MRTSIRYLNIFFIFIVIIWNSIQIIFLNFDGRGRILIFLTILVFLINLFGDPSFKKIIISKPIVWWGIWIIYSIINSVIKGLDYHDKNISVVVIQDLIMPFVVLAVVYRSYQLNSARLLKLLTFAIGVYAILGSSSISFSNGERALSEHFGNQLPIMCSILLFIVCLRFSKEEISVVKLVIWIAFSLFIILVSGTRKAFGFSVIILLFTIISYINFKSAKQLIIVLFCSLVLFMGYKYILAKTSMGERLSEIEEEGSQFNDSNLAILNKLADRSIQYVIAWDLFSLHPLSGIGLLNYMNNSGGDYRLHSEYMVQLAEGGAIGSILFLIFYMGIANGLFRSWINDFYKRRISTVLIGGFIAILFINLSAWTYSFPSFFMCFGIMIGFSCDPDSDHSRTQHGNKK